MSLADDIFNTRKSGKETDTTLKTDARVIARVTDGIYRQPGSALRELISNAFDADAATVTIDTDAPRFDKITITDDGSGMSPGTLAYVLEHIGGSAKRTQEGKKYGVSSDDNPSVSPGGRKLIGKIGIGLFSIAQLSRNFQIITKIKGDEYRTIAAVTLKSYSDNDLNSDDGESEYESGIVRIWSEIARDIEAQGTSIIITNLHPQTKHTLRSLDTWMAVDESKNNDNPISPPQFHIGKADSSGGEKISNSPFFPFESDDSPKDKFTKLVDSVWEYSSGGTSTPNLKLDQFFDYYFNMIWDIGLSIPTDYIKGHPFDLAKKDGVSAYSLSNSIKRGSTASKLNLEDVSIRDSLELDAGKNNASFTVNIDGIGVYRPIKFSNFPKTKSAVKSPLIFIGKCEQEFSAVSKEISTGVLKFEAYLLWAPKISPRDHRGVLVRINGASGTLFDDTFLKYQVAELTRLNQITCEIFVSEGLDGALNIDRESFNYAHPHFVYLTAWLHGALRQLATTQKKVSSAARFITRSKAAETTIEKIKRIPEEHWQKVVDDKSIHPPDVIFENREAPIKDDELSDSYVFPKAVVKPFEPSVNTDAAKKDQMIAEEKLRAIVQVLSLYGLLDNLSTGHQQGLLHAIASILATKNGE